LLCFPVVVVASSTAGRQARSNVSGGPLILQRGPGLFQVWPSTARFFFLF
jgi:hypothetical protein